MATDTEDYYQLLGIEDINASKEQIAKAFKKMSLIWHPDKRRNDPTAADKFHNLHKAYEVLSDEKAREAYDAVIRAKIAKRKRDSEMDARRRKMKEDLESREDKFKKQKVTVDEAAAKERLKNEMNRLRKEGFEAMKKTTEERVKKEHGSSEGLTLRVTWAKSKGAYTQDRLEQIFRMFGEINFIVISQDNSKKKKGSALVAFKNASSALLAVKQTLGDPDNPLSLSFMTMPSVPQSPVATPSTTPTRPQQSPLNSPFAFSPGYSTPSQSPISKTNISVEEHGDLESRMLRKMMEASAKQKATQNQSTP